MSQAIDTEPEAPLRSTPLDGIPRVVDSEVELREAARRIGDGSGPVAIDAERASGHRYGQRAFLLQFRRGGAGTWLIDPTRLEDFSPLEEALAGTEWILHAATQDLECLADVGLCPDRLFDTEVAARLLGLPRVGLASLTEDLLGVRLAKGHGADDWSRRPLPRRWLAYAALDVELLIDLREELTERLVLNGRWEWAEQEFAYLRTWLPTPRAEPWRRTSGVHAVRQPRNLAVVRELWSTRDEEARRRDIIPGRVLPDSAIVAAARALPRSRQELANVPGFAGRRCRLDLWWQSIRVAEELPESRLPSVAGHEGPPPPRTWQRRHPEAADRLKRARGFVNTSAEELGVSAEVLISPDPVRGLAWEPPQPVTLESVAGRLRSAGARAWQIDLTATGLTESLGHPVPPGTG